MSGADWLILATIAALFLGSIWLALVETAFTRMSRIRALTLEEEGRRGAGRLARMLEHPERTLNVVYLLALFCQLTTGSLVGLVLSSVVGAWGFVIGIVLQFVLFFVIGEVVPKTYALQHTDGAALRNSGLLAFLTNFSPLRFLSRSLIGLANLVMPGRQPREGPFVSEEEIRTMADVAADEEAIERDERQLIHSIFEFGDMVVREAMTPRTDMIAIEADETVEAGIERAIDGGFSRIPVFEDTTDNIVGLVFLKDLVTRARAGEGGQPVRGAVRPAVVVPEQKRVAELLREMRTKRFHMAVVVDEHGGTAGLVTLEDLLEEIVGDISDEYDVAEPGVEHLPDGVLRVPGKMPIGEISDELGVDLPDTEWDTVAGLVFNLLGHVPEQGESVCFQGIDFRTERVQGRRILSVLITQKDEDVDAPAPAHT
ncbi:MAG: hemolysin family protein [Acidimicrobiia bacterium]